MIYMGNCYESKLEDTKPLVKTLLDEFCEELSKTWHWNIECRVDYSSSLLCIYTNDEFLTCFSEFEVNHKLDSIKEQLDGLVRTRVGY